MTGVLEVAGLEASYGSAQVLFDIALEVGDGEVVGLLGRNGAGKTSLLRAIMGIDVKRHGAVRLHGKSIGGARTEAIARAGVGWVPDDRRIFPDLTVAENLALAGRRATKEVTAELVDALPLLGDLLDRRGTALSGGEQQVVAVARALAGRPRLLLLDEPSEGLAPVVVEALTAAIAELPQRLGVAILVADENLAVALEMSQRVYVLEAGAIVHESTAAAFAEQTELQDKYLALSGG
ncbi:MAG: transporter ATP-binding protein [Frankiales bacterium]|nr:transporter ATP-binding protein [Frankiales bacterium]